MTAARAPHYRLNKQVDQLPQGTFVCPVEDYHLPTEKKREMERLRFTHGDSIVCCYTQIGWMMIHREFLDVV